MKTLLMLIFMGFPLYAKCDASQINHEYEAPLRKILELPLSQDEIKEYAQAVYFKMSPRIKLIMAKVESSRSISSLLLCLSAEQMLELGMAGRTDVEKLLQIMLKGNSPVTIESVSKFKIRNAGDERRGGEFSIYEKGIVKARIAFELEKDGNDTWQPSAISIWNKEINEYINLQKFLVGQKKQ